MLSLYYKPTCAFSNRVLQMAENLQVQLELKDISESEIAEQELMELGGKSQTPFLVDSDRAVSMYEASDIIDHLRAHYSRTVVVATANRPRVHVSSSVCESCEG